MSERDRFSVIETASTRKRSLEERLKDQPEFKARVEKLLDVIENAAGDIEKAAEAERRVIEELRQMGNEVLHGWARRPQQKKEEEFASKTGVNRKGEKTSTGTPGTETSEERSRPLLKDVEERRSGRFLLRRTLHVRHALNLSNGPWSILARTIHSFRLQRS
jgi:predicted ribosome quality control (RQC) complex YloA/Tae2 family protein